MALAELLTAAGGDEPDPRDEPQIVEPAPRPRPRSDEYVVACFTCHATFDATDFLKHIGPTLDLRHLSY